MATYVEATVGYDEESLSGHSDRSLGVVTKSVTAYCNAASNADAQTLTQLQTVPGAKLFAAIAWAQLFFGHLLSHLTSTSTSGVR